MREMPELGRHLTRTEKRPVRRYPDAGRVRAGVMPGERRAATGR